MYNYHASEMTVRFNPSHFSPNKIIHLQPFNPHMITTFYRFACRSVTHVIKINVTFETIYYLFCASILRCLVIINSNSILLLSLSNTVCDNYTNYTHKHVTKRT